MFIHKFGIEQQQQQQQQQQQHYSTENSMDIMIIYKYNIMYKCQ